MRGKWAGRDSHRQCLTPTFLACTLDKEAAEMLPARGSFAFILQGSNGNVVIGTAFGTDTAANTTFSYIDLSGGETGDTGTATQHTDGVLTLTTGSGDTDIADHHPFTVH